MKRIRSIRDTVSQSAITVSALSSPIGEEGQVIRVDPMTCYIYEGAQRELNVKHAQRIANEFQWDKAKIPSGYRWRGKIFITDGQHTITGAAAAGVKELFVYVFDLPDSATEEEVEIVMAEQFYSINGEVKKMDRFTTHKVDLLRRYALALKVQAICDSQGVALIPPSKKKQAIAGSLSHVESAYKMVANIGEAATRSSLAFHRKYWPYEPIESNIAWGMARFFKEFEPLKEDGDAGAQYDELILYKALSNDGKRDLKDIMTHLRQVYPNLKLPMDLKGDVWIAKTMRWVYNHYVTKHNLKTPTLDSFIY